MQVTIISITPCVKLLHSVIDSQPSPKSCTAKGIINLPITRAVNYEHISNVMMTGCATFVYRHKDEVGNIPQQREAFAGANIKAGITVAEILPNVEEERLAHLLWELDSREAWAVGCSRLELFLIPFCLHLFWVFNNNEHGVGEFGEVRHLLPFWDLFMVHMRKGCKGLPRVVI